MEGGVDVHKIVEEHDSPGFFFGVDELEEHAVGEEDLIED